MTALLCALNPGRPVEIINNANFGRGPINVPSVKYGVVEAITYSATWGWRVRCAGTTPARWIIHLPISAITGPVVNLYRERRFEPLCWAERRAS